MRTIFHCKLFLQNREVVPRIEMRLSMHQSYILYLYRKTLNQEIYNRKKTTTNDHVWCVIEKILPMNAQMIFIIVEISKKLTFFVENENI